MKFKFAKKLFAKKSKKALKEVETKLNLLSVLEQQFEREKEELIHEAKKPKKIIHVSLSIDSVVKSAIAVMGVMAGVYLLYYIKNIVIIFTVALFLAAAFNPGVDRLQKYHIPRIIGIILLYILVLGIFTLIFTSLVPIIADQIMNLAYSAKDMVKNIVAGNTEKSWLMKKIQPLVNQIWENVDQQQIIDNLTAGLKQIGSKMTSYAGNAVGAIFTVFNGIFNLVLILVLTFLMVVHRDSAYLFFHSLFPHRYSSYIAVKTREAGIRIGQWVRGQILLALAMGTLTFIILSLIGLNYAMTISLVSAMGEFIPYLGPIITFSSAILIALNQEPGLVLWLIPAYAFIQIIESYIMAPTIVGKAVGLNPIVILFSVMAGATIGSKLGGNFGMGLIGMVLAVPVANILTVFVEEYTEKNK